MELPPKTDPAPDSHLIACPECDFLHVRRRLRRGDRARCVRCHATMYRLPRRRPDQILAVVVGALILFVLANAYPILDLQVQGYGSRATLLDSIMTLWDNGRELVAVTVLATTWLFPLFDLLAMVAVLVPMILHRQPAYFPPLLRLLQKLRPWGMTEVLMLGVLVSLVKLSHTARVVPGVALWSLIALTFLLAAILSYDLHALWHPEDWPHHKKQDTAP